MFISISLKSIKKILPLLLIVFVIIALFLVVIRDDYLPSNTTDMEFRVVVDAGHGSIDSGTSYGNIYEKDINLAIAKYLYNELKKVNIIPIMTRTEDKLYQDSRNKDIRYRPRVAEENSADLFISIHTNNFPSSQPSGSQLFYKNGSEESKKLAEFIQQELIKLRKENNRVIKTGDYYVLNKVTCPGVLVEVGFISNPEDRKFLTDKNYQQELARAITAGITGYLQSTFSYRGEPSVEGNKEDTVVSTIADNTGSQTGIDFTGSYLYFLDSNQQGLFLIKSDMTLPTGDFFSEEYHSRTFSEIMALEAIEQLSRPPAGLFSPLPDKTVVKSLTLENKIARIDFSKELSLNFNGGAEMEKAIIEAITKTLLSIPGIEGVEILLDGEKGSSIGGHIILNKIYKK
jgi:N-acetylmuramoyl-L-alanine amidase